MAWAAGPKNIRCARACWSDVDNERHCYRSFALVRLREPLRSPPPAWTIAAVRRRSSSIFPGIHAIGKIARKMETSDAANRFPEDQIICVLREHEAGLRTAKLLRRKL